MDHHALAYLRRPVDFPPWCPYASEPFDRWFARMQALAERDEFMQEFKNDIYLGFKRVHNHPSGVPYWPTGFAAASERIWHPFVACKDWCACRALLR